MRNEDVKAGERPKGVSLDASYRKKKLHTYAKRVCQGFKRHRALTSSFFFPISPKFEFLKIKHKIDFTKKIV